MKYYEMVIIDSVIVVFVVTLATLLSFSAFNYNHSQGKKEE